MNGVRFKNRRINIWNSATIGIEVADGVKVVDFNDAEPNVELRSVKKQFPSVETLIIGKSTSTLEISNFMFPNVKEVISENNQDFKSGNVLIKHGYDGFKLLNTFCKQTDEVIDLQDVISVSNYAFEGCLSKNIINFKLQYAEQYAFGLTSANTLGKFQKNMNPEKMPLSSAYILNEINKAGSKKSNTFRI